METTRTSRAKARPRVSTKASSDHGALLSAITHDLRAPLAAVTMGAKFVLQATNGDDSTSARSRRILEAVLRSCTQMERLVRNFADLGSIEGGSIELRLGVHDAGELLTLAAQTAVPLADARSVAIATHLPAAAMKVECDRDRMLRAIGHLVENAIGFAPEGSTVTLAVEQAAQTNGASFSISDTGPGLTAEVKKHLFDRAWHQKRTKRGAAGFGVAIARGFVLAHGGSLQVESQPGSTTFTLVIPTATKHRARTSQAHDTPGAHNGRRKATKNGAGTHGRSHARSGRKVTRSRTTRSRP